MTAGNVLRLGLRFAWPRHYVARVRTAAVALIALVTTAAALLLVSASVIDDRQQAVVDARSPLEPTQISGENGLLLVGSFVNEWDSHAVTRVVIARGEQLPDVHPPGIPRAPMAGEAYVSPAVARQLESGGPGSLLSRSLADFRIAGVIGRPGLVDPHELRIVQGVDESSTRRSVMTRTESFGTAGPLVADLTGPLAFFVPLVLCMTFLPLLLALLLAARLLSPETDQRFALLRAMGVGKATCRVIAGVELLPAAIVGALLGWASYAAGWRSLSRIPGTSLAFWSEDTDIAMVWQLGVPLTCVAVTLAVAGLAIVPAHARSTRPRHVPRTPRLWWIGPFVVGAAMLVCATFVVAHDGAATKPLAIGAAALMMIGAPFLLHLLTSRTSSWMAGRARRGWSLVGGRWLGNRQGATFRLALGMAIGLLALGATTPFAASLKGDTTRGEQGLAAGIGYNLTVTNTTLAPGRMP